MAVTIRLKRCGSKKRPFYHIVVTDSRARRDSSFIEKIGTYDPFDESDQGVVIDKERALSWLGEGSQASSTARVLLSRAGIMKEQLKECSRGGNGG